MCLLLVMTFDLFFTFDFDALIDFICWRMISSVAGQYRAKRLLHCFDIAHTHLLRGVNMPFWGLRPLTYFLTFDFVAIVEFNYWRMISLASALFACFCRYQCL